MFQFIENIKDKSKRINLIKEQNKLTLEDYFEKRTGSYKDFYQKDRYKQKACLKIITPQQSIFALVGVSHNNTANSILDAVFDGVPQKEDGNGTLSAKNNNMELGNIYIMICDTDIKSGKQNFFSKRLLDTWCNVTIYVPEVFNQYQIDELGKSIEEINKFKKHFKSRNFFLRHYIKYDDNDSNIQKKEYEDDEIYLFLDKDKGEANDYIRKVSPNPKEIILADLLKNNLRNDLKSPIQQGNLVTDGDNSITQENYEIDK